MIYEVVRGSRFERAGGHELGDQQDTLVALHSGLPGVVEAHDVGVLETLEHLHLLAEALALHFGQFARLRRKTLEKKDSDSKNKDSEVDKH